MTLTLDLASEIARTAFRDGQARGLKVMSVVITDPGGHIRLAMRSDAQGNFGIDTALGKARSALGFGAAHGHCRRRSSIHAASLRSPPRRAGRSCRWVAESSSSATA